MSLLGPNYKINLDASNPGSGPVATATTIAPDVRAKTYMSMDNNIRSKVDDNSKPIINGHRKDAQQYVNNKYVNYTGREQINPTNVQQLALKGNEQWHNLSFNDSDGYRAAKTTTNETTNFSYAGNAEREDTGGNWWRYTDSPKTTTNETTNFSYAGNAEREEIGGNWWRYSDNPKTTTNETTNFSYAGNAEREETGGNWWRYTDSPKTTTNETTNFSYAGNAEREEIGGNWWRYTDSPKTTINETTQFSYAGDIAPVSVHQQSNRQKYTGDGITSGVTKWSQKALTLVEEYFPSPNGHMNIQQNAKDKIGKSLLKDDFNNNGANTIVQSLPDGTKYQQIDKNNIGKITYSHNKYVDIDDRQVENYVVDNLTKNPLSVFRNAKANKDEIPTFFVSSNQDIYNSIKEDEIPSCEIEKDNSNTVIAMNKTNKNIENPLLYQKRIPNNKMKINGKAYLGKVNNSEIMLDNDSKNSSRYLNRIN